MKPALPDVKWKFAEGLAVTHRKTHGLYSILSRGFLHGLGTPPIPVYVYRQNNGPTFVQLQERFEDGRFVPIVLTTEAKPSLRLNKKAHVLTDLAAQVVNLRKSLGWTQGELGKKFGWSHHQVSRLERGILLEPARYRNVVKKMKGWGGHVSKKR